MPTVSEDIFLSWTTHLGSSLTTGGLVLCSGCRPDFKAHGLREWRDLRISSACPSAQMAFNRSEENNFFGRLLCSSHAGEVQGRVAQPGMGKLGMAGRTEMKRSKRFRAGRSGVCDKWFHPQEPISFLSSATGVGLLTPGSGRWQSFGRQLEHSAARPGPILLVSHNIRDCRSLLQT